MKYRNFGKIDWKPSALGFGAMRLPVENEDRGNIKEDEAIDMIRWAFDNGVNYIDTAWPYHEGNSETLVGKALKDGYRKKVKVATKLPSWEIEKADDPDEIFEEQLKKLDIEKIDFYLIHSLNKKRWDELQSVDIDIFEWMKDKRDEGKIDYLGFSFHDDLETFKEIVDTYDWDFCQIQYNYLDQDFQAGKSGLRYAAEKGLGVVIMEPLRGGKLAKEPPTSIKKIWSEAETDRSPVEWALKWLWNQPEVSLVLSGMSELKQVKENVRYASESGEDILTEKDKKIINKVAKKYMEISPVECTGCNYCVPCPNDVSIPRNFRIYNESEIYDEFDKYKKMWDERMNEDSRASNCVECGQCMDSCPQHIDIIERLKEVSEYFS